MKAAGLTSPASSQAQKQGYVLAHRNIYPICDLLDHGEQGGGVTPVDPEMQDVQDTGEQQNVHEEC